MALAFLAAAAGAGWWLARPSRSSVEVRRAIGARLAAAPSIPGDRVEAALREFYRRRGGGAAWSDGRRPNEDAVELARALEQADHEGLDPADYGVPALTVELEALREARLASLLPDAPRLAALDLRLTRGFLRFAGDLHDGRLPDSTLDADWLAERGTLDRVSTLRHALATHRVTRTLEDLAPAGAGYSRLRAALVRYRALAEAGGWPALEAGPALRRGERGERVLRLKRRLALEGDLDSTGRAPEFDLRLQRTVRAFQARHGLAGSGVVDDATRAALDVPAAERVRQIELNLERRRWLPPVFPDPHVEVSLADFTLEAHDSGRVVLRSKVVVGEPRNPTPLFSDAITYLVLDPTWRLPRRILVEEILPELARDTSYLTRHQMRVTFTHGPAPAEVRHQDVDWKAVEEDSFAYLVVQDAGDENPLGRIKFMCPNEHDVYLHDTPMKGTFGALQRAYSHGCVRVEQARALAGWLIARDTLGATDGAGRRATARVPDVRDSLDLAIASLATRRVGLREPTPVHFLYWTAWVDSSDAVQFRDDLYGLDRRLDAALRGGRTAGFVLNPAIEWGEKHRRPAPAGTAVRY
jgi:murein L,D-transpeptidase YcbB/YkuD